MEIKNASELILEKLENWIHAFIEMLPNLGLALLILIITFLLARLIRKVVMRLMHRVTHKSTLHDLIATIVYLAVILVGAFIALGVLNLDKTVTTLLAGAGIIGLALGFAFQDIAANFMSGIIMSVRMPFRVGDIIETQDKLGMVQHMNLRATLVRSFQGQVHIIPNKDVFQNTITNYSVLGKRRIDLAVGVSYGDDLEKVKQVSLQAVKSLEMLSQQEPIQFFYTEFGDSSINFELRFWISFKAQPDYLQARSDAIMAIKQAFDENDISIPFPIRTLDFGIKGGEKLTEMLPRNLSNKAS
ncbi:mechanosensitive ion channel family protein [Cesiribacter andamanensis]|uniref:Small-conductance mechanosensitive channel n=1 Tax=Cesiribacter andamanensis AMV16 TaxID=1279009 RepID=M7NJQ0_9BACT|nr:mechanosensitive ion channel family protein [Cesiribacter andamanensis]EMR02025.1 Small-conductance mechanosensitive channel [Cesiribacter andamanensis AMV16]